MFSVKFHLALDTHTVTLDSNALDLIDYTLTVVAQKKKKNRPGSGADRRPDPTLARLLRARSVEPGGLEWISRSHSAKTFACIQLSRRHAIPTAGIQPLHAAATRRAGRPEGLSGRGGRCRAPRGWRCCCARRGRPRCSTARWAPTGPPTSHARGPRRRPSPRRRWVRGWPCWGFFGTAATLIVNPCSGSKNRHCVD